MGYKKRGGREGWRRWEGIGYKKRLGGREEVRGKWV